MPIIRVQGCQVATSTSAKLNDGSIVQSNQEYGPIVPALSRQSRLVQCQLMSIQQFHRHWETVHADLTIATKDFLVCDIKRYVQFHQTPEMKEKAKSLGLEHLDFDGCSELWVKDFEDALKFFQVSQ